MDYLNNALFGIYPYIALAIFLLGSLIRFDREQYTWKSDSSQLLRTSELRWGSSLFHIGVLFLFFGHMVGLLTPHWLYESMGLSTPNKQMLAIVSGGIAGLSRILPHGAKKALCRDPFFVPVQPSSLLCASDCQRMHGRWGSRSSSRA